MVNRMLILSLANVKDTRRSYLMYIVEWSSSLHDFWFDIFLCETDSECDRSAGRLKAESFCKEPSSMLFSSLILPLFPLGQARSEWLNTARFNVRLMVWDNDDGYVGKLTDIVSKTEDSGETYVTPRRASATVIRHPEISVMRD